MSKHQKPVCVLRKALYGLRQSGLRWYQKLTAKLLDSEIIATKENSCLFVKRQEEKIILVYVGDLLPASKHPAWIDETKSNVMEAFEKKDIGTVSTCLGMDFLQVVKENWIFILQEQYINKILNRFEMSECKAPIEAKSNFKRSGYEAKSLSKLNRCFKVSFRERNSPDITFANSFPSQFNVNYNGEHWKAAKRVIRYLSGTKGLGLLYLPSEEDLYGVADAVCGANLSDRRSYPGQAFVLSGTAI